MKRRANLIINPRSMRLVWSDSAEIEALEDAADLAAAKAAERDIRKHGTVPLEQVKAMLRLKRAAQ